MQSQADIQHLVAWHLELLLDPTPYTRSILVGADPRRGYRNELHGPYRDPDNPDVRLFVTYRTLDGHTSVSLLVQDRDDDVFLDSDAVGAEKYDNRQVGV